MGKRNIAADVLASSRALQRSARLYSDAHSVATFHPGRLDVCTAALERAAIVFAQYATNAITRRHGK